ncbi:MAG TPA: type II toxin-antitoxin system RelE/ParE family toxin [Casimicrobiaceae bacterium]|nr:type II toxin-antitoxin system RelE/ParE family toxin [Casimicrobiaceae bacterium]
MGAPHPAGLGKFFETGNRAGIQPDHAERLRRQLQPLNHATAPEQLDIPGWRMHRLGTGQCSLWVNGNWRITFRFEDSEAVQFDYLYYH